MTCREVLDFLMSYLDGELSPEVRAEFERHLAVCPSCVAYLETYEKTVRLGKESAAAEPAPAPEELIQALVEILQREPPPT